MHLRILTSMAGDRFSYIPGDLVHFQDEAEAARLVKAGHAVEVAEPLEVATVGGGLETATIKTDARLHRAPKPTTEQPSEDSATETAKGKAKGKKGE